MQQRLNLNGLRPLQSGAYRSVFQHPREDDLLIKIIRRSVIIRQEKQRTWYNSWRRHGYYKAFMREFEHYLMLQQRGCDGLPFIQRFCGVVDTDIGIGMVVGKVRGRDGKLAPTLATIVKQGGLTASVRASIDQLLQDVVDNHVVISDVSATNMVLAGDGPHGDRLVVIDGFGDRLLIPIYLHSRTANAWHSAQRFRRMVRDLESLDQRGAEVPAKGPLVANPKAMKE